MDPRTRSIIVGALAVFILVVIAVIIYYLTRVYKTNTQAPTTALITPPPFLVTPSPFNLLGSPVPTGTIRPIINTNTPPAASISATSKTYTGAGFILNYPNTWGLLTCANSKNFELDPTSNQNLNNMVCDVAVKPITVLVKDQLSCPGTTAKIGNYTVIKSSSTKDDGITTNRWCVNLGVKKLDITNRVAATGDRATSTQDYSTQVEQLIQTIQVSAGS